MNPEQRVGALQGLLAKIQRNAAKAREPAASHVSTAAPAPSVPAVAPTAAQIAAIDRSIDDLLEAPIPTLQTAASHAGHGQRPQPISMEPPRAAPEPAGISSVPAAADAEEARIPTAARSPEDLVHSQRDSGIEAAGESELIEEELGEDDLLSVPPEPMDASEAAAGESELDFEEEEEVPASSQRARVASNLDDALAAVANQAEEVPLKTPPPESGPQAATPPASALEAPRVPVIHEELEEEAPLALGAGPTPEQLGETIELPEPSIARLELDVRPEVEAPPVSEELEVALPRRGEGVGIYDADLAPPSSAREDLRRFSQAAGAEPAQVQPDQLVSRPETAGGSVARFVGAKAFAPQSFLELLDASLRLGFD